MLNKVRNTLLTFSDCILGASTSTYYKYQFWLSVPLRPKEVEILRRGKLKMALASLAFNLLEVTFFPSWPRICPEIWSCLPDKLCLPLNLTLNSNLHTLLRLDISCGAALASDSRPLHPPCPSSASCHTPKSDIQSHSTLPDTCPWLPALCFSYLSPDSWCHWFQFNC